MAMGRTKDGKTAMGIAGGILILTGVASAAHTGIFDGIFGKSPAAASKAAGVIETAGEVKIPLAALDRGNALFFRQDHGDRQIHYFALKSSDGAYRAALDACDVCFRTNRGYRQEGDLMVCNNCGQAFPSVRIGEAKGGCNPHPLLRKVEGQYLVIKKSDIAAGKDYFQRKRS